MPLELVHHSLSVGNYSPGEFAHTFLPRNYVPGSRPPVIYAHSTGTGAKGFNFPGVFGQYEICHRIAAMGFPVVAGDLGVVGAAAPNDGKNTWGNATVRARIETIRALMIVFGLASDSPALLVGTSMGSLSVCQYAIANPNNVAGIVLVLGVTHLNAFYATVGRGNDATTGPLIAGAHGVVWPAALPATADVYANRAPIIDKPFLSFYATDDTAALPAESIEMEAGMGKNGKLVSVGALGHTEAGINAAANHPALRDFVGTVML